MFGFLLTFSQHLGSASTRLLSIIHLKLLLGFFFGCCLVLEAVKRQSGGEESEKENFDRLLVLKRVKTPGSSERVKVLPISLLFRENRNKVLREE